MFYLKKVALFIVGWLIAINSLNYLGFGAFMQLALGVVIGLLFTTVIKREPNLKPPSESDVSSNLVDKQDSGD